jgi:hypothetical protein
MASRQILNFIFSFDLCSKTDVFSKPVELEKSYIPLLKALSSGNKDPK